MTFITRRPVHTTAGGGRKEIDMKITITVSNSKARAWTWLLGKRYKSKRAKLERLVNIAVHEIAAAQAKIESDEAEKIMGEGD